MAANVMEIYGSKVFNEHVMKERTQILNRISFFFMQDFHCLVPEQKSRQAQRFPLSDSCNFFNTSFSICAK